jgi:hypothetical protein
MWLFNAVGNNNRTVVVNGHSGYVDGSGYFHTYSIWNKIVSTIVTIIVLSIFITIIVLIIKRMRRNKLY